jgi:hypothetical protein
VWFIALFLEEARELLTVAFYDWVTDRWNLLDSLIIVIYVIGVCVLTQEWMHMNGHYFHLHLNNLTDSNDT